MTTWYREGLVTLTSGSDLVAGAGTEWVDNVLPGGIFFTPAGLVEVERVISDSSLKLVTPYDGATVAGAEYSIAPTQGYVVALAKQLNGVLGDFGELKDAWQDGTLVGKGVALKGVKDAVGELPGAGNAPGDAWMVDGHMHVWTGTFWKDQGATVSTPELEALRDAAETSAGVAVGSALAADATRKAYEDRLYPGTYVSLPTTKPSGAPIASGDRAVIFFSGTPYEHVYLSGAWMIPNIDAANLAMPTGAAIVGAGAEGKVQDALNNRAKKTALSVNVLDFALAPEGNNMSPALGRALDVSRSIDFPPGVAYQATSILDKVLTADTTIYFNGHEIAFTSYWRFSGEVVATGRTLIANCARYATGISLNSTASIQRGDLIYLNTSIAVETAWNYTKKDLNKVRSVGATIELEETNNFAYTTADAGLSVSVVRPHRLTLVSPNFRLAAVAGQAMCELRYLEPLVLDPVGAGDMATFSPSTDETRRMFQLYACWHPRIRNLDATALSYPVLAVAGTRETNIDGYKARFCRHAGEATDWVKGFHVWGLRASDCYQAVSSHPAFGVSYDDVVVERDSALSNLRCVGGSLRNARIHTLADDLADGPYFHSLAMNVAFADLYSDADMDFDKVVVVSPNRSKPTLGCERARVLRLAGVKAAGFSSGVQNGIASIQEGSGNEIGGRSSPRFGPTAIRSGKFKSTRNPLLPAYLDGGLYHINPRLELVDQADKYLKCYGPVVNGLTGSDPQVLSLRIHDHGFSSVESLTAVIGVLKLKGFITHANTGLFAYIEKTFNFYHKISAASAIYFPLVAIATTGKSGQAFETLDITVSNPTQAGVTELGGLTDPDARTDYYLQFDVSLTSGRTSPIFSLNYELELSRPN